MNHEKEIIKIWFELYLTQSLVKYCLKNKTEWLKACNDTARLSTEALEKTRERFPNERITLNDV